MTQLDDKLHHLIEEKRKVQTQEEPVHIPPSLTTPEQFLQAATDTLVSRGTEYDSTRGERSMGKTVLAFNTITGQNLTEAEGWLLLQLLKDVRQWTTPESIHEDSALDGVAYSALKCEALTKGRTSNKENN